MHVVDAILFLFSQSHSYIVYYVVKDLKYMHTVFNYLIEKMKIKYIYVMKCNKIDFVTNVKQLLNHNEMHAACNKQKYTFC